MGATRRRVRAEAMSRLVLACGTITTGFVAPVAAQTALVVQGQVVDAGSGAGVANAVVSLEEHGTTLTAAGGHFRFDGVAPAAYDLRVDAFGYAPRSVTILVDRDTTVQIPVQIAPFLLDSLVVAPRMVDFEGRVRDSTRDLDLIDATVFADGEQPTRTDSRGRFTLGGVLADARLGVVIRAFGYLPLDTTVVPRAGTGNLFELQSDTIVERLVAVQVERIEDRAAPRRAALMRPMNRERLLIHAGRRTLADVLVWEYGESRLRAVECVVVDEKQLLGTWQPTSLFHILPEQLERIEFLDTQGTMLRIYTRDFMREMISRDVELRTPTLFGWSDHVHVPAACR
jgi:hypothetical protein